jgi:hypothetical protein
MQFSTYYKPINNPDPSVCDAFLEDLLKSPQSILDKIRKSGSMEAIQKGIEEFKNTDPA